MKYTSRSNLNDVWIETITVNKYKKLELKSLDLLILLLFEYIIIYSFNYILTCTATCHAKSSTPSQRQSK